MPNKENLIPLNKRSKEEAKKIQTSGGIAIGKKKTQAKTLKECAQLLMSLDVKDEKAKKTLQGLGITDDNYTNGMLATVAMFKEAMKGNTQAYRMFMDTYADTQIGADEQEKEHDNLISAIKKAVDDED